MREPGDRRADRMAPFICRYLTDLRTLPLHGFLDKFCPPLRYEDMMYYVVFHRTKSGGGVVKYILTYYPD